MVVASILTDPITFLHFSARSFFEAVLCKQCSFNSKIPNPRPLPFTCYPSLALAEMSTLPTPWWHFTRLCSIRRHPKREECCRFHCIGTCVILKSSHPFGHVGERLLPQHCALMHQTSNGNVTQKYVQVTCNNRWVWLHPRCIRCKHWIAFAVDESGKKVYWGWRKESVKVKENNGSNKAVMFNIWLPTCSVCWPSARPDLAGLLLIGHKRTGDE